MPSAVRQAGSPSVPLLSASSVARRASSRTLPWKRSSCAGVRLRSKAIDWRRSRVCSSSPCGSFRHALHRFSASAGAPRRRPGCRRSPRHPGDDTAYRGPFTLITWRGCTPSRNEEATRATSSGATAGSIASASLRAAPPEHSVDRPRRYQLTVISRDANRRRATFRATAPPWRL